MKRFIPLIAFCLGFLAMLPGCKKDLSFHQTPATSPISISEAQTWFHSHIQSLPIHPDVSNPRTAATRTLLWDQARTIHLSDRPALIVPLHYKAPLYIMNNDPHSPLFAVDQAARLVIYRDSIDQYHAEVITGLPDSSYSQGTPTGY